MRLLVLKEKYPLRLFMETNDLLLAGGSCCLLDNNEVQYTSYFTPTFQFSKTNDSIVVNENMF